MTIDRIVSLSVLSALTLSFAPLASAQGFGGFGRGGERQQFRQSLSEDVRNALKTCREDNDSREDRRACAQQVFEDNNIERPEFGRRGRRGRRGARQEFRQNLSEDVRNALQSCREDNDSHEDRRACAKSVFEANGIEKPEHGSRSGKYQFFQSLDENVQNELKACRENNDSREEAHECVKGVLDSHGIEKPEGVHRRRIGNRIRRNRDRLSEEAREELRACRDEDSREEKIACIRAVINEHRDQ